MRVLIATAYYDSHRGGIEIVAGRLARELASRGAAVTWLATDATPPTADGSYDARPIAAWNITERRLGVPLPLPGLGAMWAIGRAVAEADVVMLHDSLYPTNVVARLAAARHGKPVVLVQHIAEVPYANPLLRLLMRTANVVITRPMLRAADQVVFISETVAAHFATLRYRAPPRVIFNGVDTAMFTPPGSAFDRAAVRVRLGLPVDRPVALFVGRFVEKKGLHAIRHLATLRPEVTFALAGWGPIDPTAWGLPNVHVLSGLSGATLADAYRMSDVFVLPSVGEGLPLVVQEALGCGLPVICGAETVTADPAFADVLTGVAIAADPATTATAVATALDGALAAAAMSRGDAASAGRHAFVVARYSWAEAAETYLTVMRGLRAARGVTTRPVPAQ